MNDRELIELAAKACGYDTSHPWNADRLAIDPPVDVLCIDGVSTGWNPLEDDGNALRLAVKLGIQFCADDFACDKDGMAIAQAWECQIDCRELYKGDPYAATRRAIVRAAAEFWMERRRMMAMTRQQLHNMAAVDRYNAGKNKPLERRRVQSFMSPITRAFNQMMTGETDVDAVTAIPITRLSHKDAWEETHLCINGFVAAMERLLPDVDIGPLRWVSSDLIKGKLMNPAKVLAAKRTLKEIEDCMVKKTWQQVMDATQTTQIEIHMEQLGFKEAA